MKVIIKDEGVLELITTGTSKKYKRLSKDITFKKELVKAYMQLCAAPSVNQLPPSHHFEALKYQYSGLYSYRIMHKRTERFILSLDEENQTITITILELDDTHYGNGK